MLQLPVSEVIRKICEEKSLTKEQVQEKINAKLNELTGLISEEGAAYIVASELGVQLFADLEKEGRLRIKDVLIGMRNVDVVGKVIRTFESRTFKKGEKVGQVGSFIIQDDTDKIRIVIWDERVSWLKTGKIKEGVLIGIKGAIAKESNLGGKELHLSIRSQIILNPDVQIEIPEFITPQVQTKPLSEVSANDSISTISTIVQVFRPRFYPVCPNCNKSSPGNKCQEHGDINPNKAMVFSFVIDDGTKPMRCTAFGSQSVKIINLTPTEAEDTLVSGGEIVLLEKVEEFLLGRDVEIQGKVNYNKQFDRTELRIFEVNLDPSAELIANQLLSK